MLSFSAWQIFLALTHAPAAVAADSNVKLLECSGDLGHGLQQVNALVEISERGLSAKEIFLTDLDGVISVVANPFLLAAYLGNEIQWIYMQGDGGKTLFAWEGIHQSPSGSCRFSDR